MNRTLSVATIALAMVALVAAARAEDAHDVCDMPPSYVPAALLERALPLRTGIGNSHEVVTTSSPRAQAYYDQGLNYLESYVWIEASRSFLAALRLDPKLAMACVGLSRVHSGLEDPEGARRWFEKAKTLASGASPRERRRIDIREKQLAAIDALEDGAKFLAYKKAIDDALVADYDDPGLWLLRGNAEESNATGRGQRGTAASVACYEHVLTLVPDHASAHHFLVHSFEGLGRIDQALAHGEAYARLAPAIPHATHMWAHDLRRVGRIDEAIAQFSRADSLEHAYYAAEKIEPGFDWHHGHNLDLLATCYEHRGQMKLAERTMRESAALPVFEAGRAFNARELPNFLLHRGRYDEALRAARALASTNYPQSRAVGHALAGSALLALGRTDEASGELTEAQHELANVPAVTPNVLPRRSTVAPWVEALRGEWLLRTGKSDEGRTVFREVTAALRASPGPDAWTQSLFRLETMARTARELGEWDLAEFLARQMIDHDKAYGGSHLALALVLEHRGDSAGAAAEREAARGLWRQADRDLPELQQVAATRPVRR